MSRTVHVRAPSRLHFGMFSFGRDDVPQFGGVGAMIEPPTIDVTVTPSPDLAIHGSLTERVQQVVDMLTAHWNLAAWPACAIRVHAPRHHTGLGVGTQLALSVAVALQEFLARPPVPIAELATSLQRASRSSVGTIGFQHGGLIFDHGKRAGQALSSFSRETLPVQWRFVLISSDDQGLTGDVEAGTFARLPPVPECVTAELHRIADDEIAPAARRHDCAAFGDAVYRFGRLAGECFAPAQGGLFASADIEALVEAIRDHGVPGAGQSSWGPTVFAIVANEEQAQSLAGWIGERFSTKRFAVTIAAPNNVGAQVSVVS